MNEPTPQNATIWLMTGDVPAGPFEPSQIHAKLAAGEVSWQTLACPVGGATWLPLVRFPGFGPATEAPAPVTEPLRGHHPVPAPVAPVARQSRTWNPTAVAWPGLLFMPLWAAVMATVNGRRLKSPTPSWLPAVIVVGWWTASEFSGSISESYFFHFHQLSRRPGAALVARP